MHPICGQEVGGSTTIKRSEGRKPFHLLLHALGHLGQRGAFFRPLVRHGERGMRVTNPVRGESFATYAESPARDNNRSAPHVTGGGSADVNYPNERGARHHRRRNYPRETEPRAAGPTAVDLRAPLIAEDPPRRARSRPFVLSLSLCNTSREEVSRVPWLDDRNSMS